MTRHPPLRFDLVGFDLDGTLLDSSEDLRAALNATLTAAGRRAVTSAEARALIGGGTRKMLERGLALTGAAGSREEIARLTADLVAHYEANIAVHTRPFPGGLAALDALAEQGVAVALVTNKLERLAVKLVDALGLAPRFAVVLGGDSLGPGKAKPAPDLLHEMVARSGRGHGGRAAYVGDTTYDVRAARAAAMPVVAVRFGFCDLPPDELGADAVIDHFDGLMPALAAL